jgi:hypothetical protein
MMTARQKIEGLTNSWYGFAVFMSLLSLWRGGIGFLSLATTAASFVFTIFLTWFVGRRLLKKSSLMRLFLIVVTGVISVLDTVGVAKMGLTFFQTFSFSALAYVGVLGIHLYMNARSFRVLTDKSVKLYFA